MGVSGPSARPSAAALERLPQHALGILELDADPAWRLAAAFLVGFRGHTRRAYFKDIKAWYAWCVSVAVARPSTPSATMSTAGSPSRSSSTALNWVGGRAGRREDRATGPRRPTRFCNTPLDRNLIKGAAAWRTILQGCYSDPRQVAERALGAHTVR